MVFRLRRYQCLGARTNGRWTNLLGWITIIVTFLCALALIGSWFL